MRCGEVKGPDLSVEKLMKTRWLKMMLGPSPGGDAQWCLGLKSRQAGEVQHTLETMREGGSICVPLAPPNPAALMFVCKGSGRNLPL